MKPTLTTRKAEPADLPALLALRQEIIEWLASKGLDQWQPGSPGRWTPDGVAASIDAGTVWVIYDGAQLVASITIDDYADPDLWTEEERAEPSLYLHRMMVARSHAGLGLGPMLLRLGEAEAQRAGAAMLRLDAWRDSESLHEYYVASGFTHRRTVVLGHRGSGALFERKVSLGEDSAEGP
jgi:GNAT superfamily N-acetyltransferase